MLANWVDSFPVIAKVIFGVFIRHNKILANWASPPNIASPAHVVGPLLNIKY